MDICPGTELNTGEDRNPNSSARQELLAAGAIGELNMVEAYWNRNSPIGAWQYTIPPDASPQTVDWERFLGPAPKRPFDATRFFRWRNYDDYGTGVAGDLFVHLFTGIHFITGSTGPNRVFSTGGIRYWKDGRDAPDVLLGLFDYPKTAAHPEFTLTLRVNFAAGAGGEDAFRFVGPEGIMSLGRDGITITKRDPDKEPGYTIDTFPKAIQDAYLAEYHKKYPETKPLATVPPKLLAKLPRLPEELQYRFFDRHLILLDVDADLIVDYIPDALPAATA